MAETRVLTDHEEIRDWAAARAGQPVLRTLGSSQDKPVLAFAFGQQAYQDTDRGWDEIGEVEIVEWDEWFRLFDERELALVVAEDVPGQREEFHEFIRRP